MSTLTSDQIIFRFIAGVIGLIVLAALLAFIVIPAVQGQQAGIDVWTSICRAVGIAPGTPSASNPQTTGQAAPASTVAWDAGVLNRLDAPKRELGAQLAQELCSACHGESGVSPSNQFPHIAGQSALAIYKQLHDYKSGARVNELMSPVAQPLTEEQMIAVSNHYASLAKGTLDRRLNWITDPVTDTLVRTGDTARGIPGCQSCHGVGTGGPMETPTISGQYREYLALQLTNYANGTRRNDVFNRMRDIASRLTPEEIQALANYYAAQ